MLAEHLLRIAKRRLIWTHEVVWFAEGPYDRGRFPADVTYFRQHRLAIPNNSVVKAEPFDTLLVDLKLPRTALFQNFSKTTRYEIGRSERENILVHREEGAEAVRRFIQRHREFSRRKGLGKGMSGEQYAAYQGHTFLYSATREDTWLATLLLIHDGVRGRQWVMISDQELPDRALVGYASRAVVWHSICAAKEHGFSEYDFGGVVLDENSAGYGITRFKLSFGGTHLREHNSLVIPSSVLRSAYQRTKQLVGSSR